MRQQRIIIENVAPQLQGGAFFIKRVIGETVTVTADILGDGHDVLQAEVCYKPKAEKEWQTVRLNFVNNDAYTADFRVEKQGFYEYKIRGWIDDALNWQHGIELKIKDGQHVKSELLDGVKHLEAIMTKVQEYDAEYLENAKTAFEDEKRYDVAISIATADRLHDLFFQSIDL